MATEQPANEEHPFGDLCVEFYKCDSTTPHDKEMLRRFLQAEPKYGSISSLLPVDEMEDKLDAISKIAGRLSKGDKSLNHGMFCLFYEMPVTTLRGLLGQDRVFIIRDKHANFLRFYKQG